MLSLSLKPLEFLMLELMLSTGQLLYLLKLLVTKKAELKYHMKLPTEYLTASQKTLKFFDC